MAATRAVHERIRPSPRVAYSASSVSEDDLEELIPDDNDVETPTFGRGIR